MPQTLPAESQRANQRFSASTHLPGAGRGGSPVGPQAICNLPRGGRHGGLSLLQGVARGGFPLLPLGAPLQRLQLLRSTTQLLTAALQVLAPTARGASSKRQGLRPAVTSVALSCGPRPHHVNSQQVQLIQQGLPYLDIKGKQASYQLQERVRDKHRLQAPGRSALTLR